MPMWYTHSSLSPIPACSEFLLFSASRFCPAGVGDSGDLAAILVRIRARALAGPEESRSRIPALAAAYGKAHPKIRPAQYCR